MPAPEEEKEEMPAITTARRRWILPLLALVSLSGSQGCAAVGLTLFGVGAGVTAGTGVSYTLDGIAYRTFTVPEERLAAATLKTLQRMDIEVRDIAVNGNRSAESGRMITAVAGDRTIEIQLDRLTAKTTRMRVNAKQGWFFKDRATAMEIIAQTEQTLDDEAGTAKNSK